MACNNIDNGIGVEDTLLGFGKVNQIRNGKLCLIEKINAFNIPYDENLSIGELELLLATQLQKLDPYGNCDIDSIAQHYYGSWENAIVVRDLADKCNLTGGLDNTVEQRLPFTVGDIVEHNGSYWTALVMKPTEEPSDSSSQWAKFEKVTTLIETYLTKCGIECNSTEPICKETIHILGDSIITVDLNSASYEELGAVARDCDGKPIPYTVDGFVDTFVSGTYHKTYTTPNGTSAIRNIVVRDTSLPYCQETIELNGESTLYVKLNGTYSELGVTAVDCNNNNVPFSVNGSVDTSTLGTYVINYTTTNTNITIQRTIIVREALQNLSEDEVSDVATALINECCTLMDADNNTPLNTSVVDNTITLGNGESDIQLVDSYTVNFVATDDVEAGGTILVGNELIPLVDTNGNPIPDGFIQEGDEVTLTYNEDTNTFTVSVTRPHLVFKDIERLRTPIDTDKLVIIVGDRGGRFIYDETKSTIDNNGTIIKGWVRQYPYVLTPELFGASTNPNITDINVVDDLATEAIQAGIEESALTNKPLYLDKVYKIDEPLVLKKGCNLYGKGIIYNWGAVHMIVTATPSSNFPKYSNHKNLTIDGITLHNNYSMFPTQSGALVELCHSSDITISNCNFYEPIESHTLDIAGCRDVLITNCNFYGHVKVNYVAKEVIQLQALTELGSSQPPFDGTACKNITIDNCYFGKDTSSNSLHTSTNVVYPQVAIGGHGSVLDKVTDNVAITNCTFDSCSYTSFRIFAWDNVTVSDNTMLNCNIPLGKISPIYNHTISSCNSNQLPNATDYVNNYAGSVCHNKAKASRNIFITNNQVEIDANFTEDVLYLFYAEGTFDFNVSDFDATTSIWTPSSPDDFNLVYIENLVYADNNYVDKGNLSLHVDPTQTSHYATVKAGAITLKGNNTSMFKYVLSNCKDVSIIDNKWKTLYVRSSDSLRAYNPVLKEYTYLSNTYLADLEKVRANIIAITNNHAHESLHSSLYLLNAKQGIVSNNTFNNPQILNDGTDRGAISLASSCEDIKIAENSILKGTGFIKWRVYVSSSCKNIDTNSLSLVASSFDNLNSSIVNNSDVSVDSIPFVLESNWVKNSVTADVSIRPLTNGMVQIEMTIKGGASSSNIYLGKVPAYLAPMNYQTFVVDVYDSTGNYSQARGQLNSDGKLYVRGGSNTITYMFISFAYFSGYKA